MFALLDLYLGEHLSQRFAAEILADDRDGRLLYVRNGSPMWRAVLAEHAAHLRDIPHNVRPIEGYEFRAEQWTKDNALILQPRNARYAIWTLLDESHEITGWYINFAERHMRGDVTAIRDLNLTSPQLATGRSASKTPNRSSRRPG